MSGSLRKDTVAVTVVEEYQQAIDAVRVLAGASNYVMLVCALAQERVAELSRRADIEDTKTEEKP